MIRVTIWNEYVQEQLGFKRFDFQKEWNEENIRKMKVRAEEIRRAHQGGAIHDTLKALFEESGDAGVRTDGRSSGGYRRTCLVEPYRSGAGTMGYSHESAGLCSERNGRDVPSFCAYVPSDATASGNHLHAAVERGRP